MAGLPERLRMLRAQRGLSGQALADSVGISQGMISAYERNEKQPTITNLEKIALVLDVSIDYLLGNCEEPNGTIVPMKQQSTNDVKPEKAEPVNGAVILEHATTLRRELKENIYLMDSEDMSLTRDILISCTSMIDSLTDTEKQSRTAG